MIIGAVFVAVSFSCVVTIINSTTEGEGGYVFTLFLSLFVCLSICLCAGYLKKLWTDQDEILWTGWVYDKNEPIRLG